MPGGTVCSVAVCQSNSQTARRSGENLMFFSFPNDPTIQKEWIRRCYRKDTFSAKNKRICSKHFKPQDFEDEFQANLMKFQPRKLKKTAIPSVSLLRLTDLEETSLPSPVSPERSVLREIKARSILTSDPLLPTTNTKTDKSPSSSSEKNVSTPIKYEEIIIVSSPSSTTSIAISHKMCRLCLREEPYMWSFFSLLTFEDKSTLDVMQTFQHLTGESKEQIENPKLPNYLCETCIGLLVNANAFRQKYERSSQILVEFLSKEPVDESANFNGLETTTAHEEPEEDNNAFLEEDSIASSLMESQVEDLNVPIPNNPKIKKVETVKKHRCPICLDKYTALELRRHCQTHEALKPYLNAAPKFNKKVRFYAKQRTKNLCLFEREKVSHSCPFCAEEFDGLQFKDHIKQHRLEGNFRCSICNRIFLGRNHLKLHQLTHKQEAPFKCQECGKEFFRQNNFDFHKLKHTKSDDLPFKCQYCQLAFSNPEHLKRHKFSHEKLVSYQAYYKKPGMYVKCKQCLQKFKTQDELEDHNCKLCCAKCHKIFDRKKEFAAHVCKFKLKRSKCDFCGKVFQLASSYKIHKYRCSQKTLCYVCGKNVANITQHLQTHYPQKKSCYTCAQCQKQFRLKVSLNRHITEVHLSIVAFHCQFCWKGFKSRRSLTVHERIHLGVKKHVCSICNKGFLEKSYLKKHWRTHLRKDDLLLEQTNNDLNNI